MAEYGWLYLAIVSQWPTERYNRSLSQRRAEATVEYITAQGISADRLQAKGFGESNPVNKCSDGVKCPEEEHQANRRSEFIVSFVP